jgi:hypothetical protein
MGWCGDQCGHFFKFFDAFGQPVQMQFRLSTKFKTRLGGIISLILYIIFIAIFVYLYYDVDAKTNSITTLFNSRYSDPPSYNITTLPSDMGQTADINKAFFFYAFAVVNLDGYPITKQQFDSVFYIEALENSVNKTTGKTTIIGQYEFVKCSDIHGDLSKYFTDPQLSYGFCLNKTQVQVQGDFVSPIYRYMGFKMKDCSKSVLKSKPTCADKATVSEAFLSWQVIFLYSDYSINGKIHDSSPVEYLLRRMNLQITRQIYQKFDMYISKMMMQSYENLYFPWGNPRMEPFLTVNRINPAASNPGSSYIAIYLRSEYTYVTYTRNYKSVIQLLGQIGGIWQVIFLIGAFLMVPLSVKLMKVAIANELFNIIPPGKDLEKQTYRNFKQGSTANDPDKVIKLNNKSPLECKMAIRYYKYERNKGMDYTIQEALGAIFFMCFKPANVKKKERVFKHSEAMLMKKLSSSALLAFSKQVNSLKKVLLGNRDMMVSFSHKYAVHEKKLKFLKMRYEQYLENQELENVELALFKEVDFINGLRAMKLKISGLHEKIDVNLLKLFKFRPRHMAKYFLAHYSVLEQHFPKIKNYRNVVNQPEGSDESDNGMLSD